MSNAYQLNDNRNGYSQTPEQQQYMSQINSMPCVYFPAGVPCFQAAPVYQQQMYPQSTAHVPTMAHPQHTYSQNIVANTVTQTQVLPMSSLGQKMPLRRILNIVDPETREKVNIEPYKHVKTTTSEIPTSSAPLKVSVPIKITTPPPKGIKIIPDPEPVVSLVELPQEVAVESQCKPDFSLNSEEEAPSDNVSHEIEESEELSEESDASQSNVSLNALDVEDEELSSDEKCNDLSDNTKPVESPPQSPKIKRVESDSSGFIQKYDREQLISIRSSTDFSNFPVPPMSVVTNVGANSLRQKIRSSHRPQSRRVLTFNTEAVVLDEVENAYKPSHLKKTEDISSDRLSQLSRDLNIVLNRLLDSNVPEVIDDIRKVGIKGEEEVTCLVNAITNKAARQPLYSKAFARLCGALVDAKADGFKEKLLKTSCELFSTPLKVHLENVKTQLDKKISETSDEKVKKMLEEDRETVVTKKRESFFGIMRFFSYLFLENVISDKSFTDALRPFAKPKSQDDVLALLACLNICGEAMDRKGMAFVKQCINGLENAKKGLKVEQYVQYKIIGLLELRQCNWKSVESVPAPQTATLPRSNSSRDSLVHRVPVHNVSRKLSSTLRPTTGKIGDSKTPIDTTNLAVSSLGNRSSYLGPHYDWSQGSKAQPRQQKSGTASESDNGKESRASSLSTIKREANQASQFKIDENLTAEDARRDAIDAFTTSDTPKFDLLLRESEKKELVRGLVCKALESRANEREMIVNILAHLYSKRQLNDEQMELGFAESIHFSDDLDCPKLGEYIGELASSMLVASAIDFSKIVKLIRMLPDDKDKREALAQCIKFAAKRINKGEIAVSARKVLTPECLGGNEKVFKEEEFLKRYQIEYLMETSPTAPAAASVNAIKQWREVTPHASSLSDDPSISEQIDKCLQKMDLKELTSVCSRNAKSKDSDKYLKKIFSHGRGLHRKEIEALVPVVKIFVHSVDSEQASIFCLQGSVDKDGFRAWLHALIQQKVLTPQSLVAYTNDKRSLTTCKEVALQICRKCRSKE